MKFVHVTFLFLVVASLVCLNGALSQNHIGVPIKVVHANTDSITLTFGFDKLATHCLDTVLSAVADTERDLPPLPPAGIFDARFVDPRGFNADCMDQGTLKDFRFWATQTTIDTFEVDVLPGSGTGTFVYSWPSGLGLAPDSLQSCRLQDQFGGIVVNVDMLVDTTKSVSTTFAKLYIIVRPLINSVKTISNLVPSNFALNQNYPNPFNPSTMITFAVQKAVIAQVAIYDILGRKVKTLASEQLLPGTYKTEWNGVDDRGNAVSTGVYYVRMVANDASTGRAVFSAVRKLMLAK